jgi:multiple sugar transport system substrate-binding protein
MPARLGSGLIALVAAGLAAGTIACRASSSAVVWWTPSWGQARAATLARQFEAANPGVTVKIEVTVADGLPTRIQTALRSGSPPDLIEAQHGWVVPYAQAGLLDALDDVVSSDDRADYVPAALDYDTWNGHLWGAPYRIETHAILFNKRLFREVGLDPDDPPQTWPDLIDAARRLTRTTAAGRQQYGLAITGGGEVGNTLFRVLPLIWMNGGAMVSDDLTRATVNARPAVDAVTFYTDLFTRYHVSPPSTLQDDGLADRRLFIAETVAMYQSGQFDLGVIRQERPSLEIGAMMLPHPDGRPTAAALGGWSFIVPKGAPHADAARRLVRFLCAPSRMGTFTDTFPARTSAMDLPRFADPLLVPFRQMLPFGRRVPPAHNWLQIVQVFFDQLQRILLQEASPQQAMDDAAVEIQRLLVRP